MQHIWEVAKREWALQYPDEPQPFLTCTHRSDEEQAKLYAKGRTKPGPKVTNAAPGQSEHNKLPSPAFDIAFKNADGGLDWSNYLFEQFATIVKPMGVDWGGDFRSIIDRPHFQQKNL
jgi:peptidoglycan L-alanyl-D-glutamate endopeptidase CwlK